MPNCDRYAANSCEGLIHVDWADFFAQRRGSKQHDSRTASASNALLSRENRSSQLVHPNAECSRQCLKVAGDTGCFTFNLNVTPLTLK